MPKLEKMTSIRAIFSLLILSISLTVFAQKPESKKQEEKTKLTKEEKKAKRLQNIYFINKNFFIRPAYSIQYNQLRITDRNGIGAPLNYRPNILGSAGGQVKLGGIVLSYMYRLPVSEQRLDKFGKTDYQNIGINIQTRYVGLNFDYIDYKGFYVANPNEIPLLNISSEGEYPQFPNLNYFSIGVGTTFAFKKTFSINSAFTQTERMKKSAGSFMMRVGNRFTQIGSGSQPFIPDSEQQYHQKFFQNDFRGITYNTTYMALGAGYSIVKKYFSFTPIVLIGTGIQYQGYADNRAKGLDNAHLRMPFYFAYKNAVGYNHDNFFMRIIWSAELDRTQVKPKGQYGVGTDNFIDYKNETDNTVMSMFYLNGEVSLGVRFVEKKTKAEKKAKKAAKKG